MRAIFVEFYDEISEHAPEPAVLDTARLRHIPSSSAQQAIKTKKKSDMK
jgi:hypothetical protein